MNSPEIQARLSLLKPEQCECEELDAAIAAIASMVARQGLDLDSAELILNEADAIDPLCRGRQESKSTFCDKKETECGHRRGPNFLVTLATSMRLSQIEEDKVSL